MSDELFSSSKVKISNARFFFLPKMICFSAYCSIGQRGGER